MDGNETGWFWNPALLFAGEIEQRILGHPDVLVVVLQVPVQAIAAPGGVEDRRLEGQTLEREPSIRGAVKGFDSLHIGVQRPVRRSSTIRSLAARCVSDGRILIRTGFDRRIRLGAKGRWKGLIMLINVQQQPNANLVQVAQAFGLIRLLLGLRQSRQQHPGQDGDNRNHDQKLDQRERAGSSGAPPSKVWSDPLIRIGLATAPKRAEREQAYEEEVEPSLVNSFGLHHLVTPKGPTEVTGNL
jgi:hypothetical protein